MWVPLMGGSGQKAQVVSEQSPPAYVSSWCPWRGLCWEQGGKYGASESGRSRAGGWESPPAPGDGTLVLPASGDPWLAAPALSSKASGEEQVGLNRVGVGLSSWHQE